VIERVKNLARDPNQTRARSIAPPLHQIATGKIEPSQWDDPDHIHKTGTRTVRQVYGFRVADPLVKLHAHSPRSITRRHLEASRRLRDDYEIAHEVGTVDSIMRLGAPRSATIGAGPAATRLDAMRRCRSAQDACAHVWDVVALVVLAGWSLARWAQHVAKNPHAARERLAIGLDLLADYYGVPRDTA
jgi:hypothetical protein